MTGWRKQPVGDLPLYQARTMAWLPRVVQGFTTRHGGVSVAPYESLNLCGHVGDAPASVQANRQRLWSDLGFAETQVALAEQVHGAEVVRVTAGGAPVPGADALVTDTPEVLLLLFFADCVPIYIYDPVRKAVGLAHAGWRGTAANIAARTVEAMTQEFGTKPGDCLAAVGPSIGAESYEFSHGLGAVIIGIGFLIALHPVRPELSALGSALLILMACTTLSFLVTTPEAWVPALGDANHGFPYLSGVGRLIVKDVIMLAAAVVTLSDSARTALRRQASGER